MGSLDPRTGRHVGLSTEPTFGCFDDLISAYRRQLEHFLSVKIRGSNVIERIYATLMTGGTQRKPTRPGPCSQDRPG